jgi:glutaminase
MAEAGILREHGHSIQVIQLQGNLALSTAEVVVHDVMSSLAGVSVVLLDLKHVLSVNESASRLFYQLLLKLQEQGIQLVFTNAARMPQLRRDLKHVLSVNESASRLFYQLLLKLQEQGIQLVFTNAARMPQLRRYLKLKLKEQFESLCRSFEDNDTALEWCENRLLAQKLGDAGNGSNVAAANYQLFAGLGLEDIVTVRSRLERRRFQQGETIIRFGEKAGELFFLTRGCASATLSGVNGTTKRLGTFSPGMAFGEMALLDESPRSATVKADTEVECDVLKIADFRQLGENHPRIIQVMMRNLALGLSRNLKKRNLEFSVFDY